MPGAKSAGKTQDSAANDIPASPEVTGPGSQRVASNDQLPTPEPMSGNSFRWPVKGRVIAEFGARPTAATMTASTSRCRKAPR